jgi:hypothetical protein
MADAAAATDLDRAGRVVDRDHLLTALLEVERDATGPRTNVENAATRIAHPGAVVRRPAAKGGQVEGCPKAAPRDEAIVTLDDLGYRLALEACQQHCPIRIGALTQPRRH